ncbi:MAG: hypothetical protein HC854_03600 [Flavobacterium sp.]|nr:hypothetical protein [Flavobacterium sp.]
MANNRLPLVAASYQSTVSFVFTETLNGVVVLVQTLWSPLLMGALGKGETITL